MPQPSHYVKRTNMFLFFFTLVCFALPNIFAYHIIQTPSGFIQGTAEILQTETVFQFRNIPYAKPPLGDLRFRKPRPYGSWSGVRDGTRFGPSCIQPMQYTTKLLQNMDISEDCLSLNVYVPHHLPQNGSVLQSRAVMVWIHGGSFLIGQGESYDASALAARGDVIVVTINYRLGFLGFLSTGDNSSLGNFGLWDQHLALKWVKNNIAAFGGNHNSITLFGQSAGAISVCIHSLALVNKGLFQRVIAQSGVSNSFYATLSDAYYFAKHYSIQLQCINSTASNIDTYKLVSCLRQKTSIELLDAQTNLYVNRPYEYGIRQAPVVDGDFLVDAPHNLLNNNSSESYKFFKSLDFITGNCNNEATIMLFHLKSESYGTLETEPFNYTIGVSTSLLCKHIIPRILQDLYPNNTLAKYGSSLICNRYRSSNLKEQGNLITEMYTDLYFFAPAVETLNAHTKDNTLTNTYQYVFNVPDILNDGPPRPPWYRGSSHGAELEFLFGLQSDQRILALPFSDKYIALSDSMLRYWSNFAKTGDPNGVGLPVWPRYNIIQKDYLNLNTTISSRTRIYGDRMDFWIKTFPIVMRNKTAVPVLTGK